MHFLMLGRNLVRDGATVEVTRTGADYDLNVKSPAGYTMATIRLTHTEYVALQSRMRFAAAN